MIKNNYFEDILNKVKKLIVENNFQEAHQILQEELSMPYIPSEYEQEYKQIFSNVCKELKLKAPAKNFNLLSENDVEEILTSNTTNDQDYMVVDFLKSSNIRKYLNNIKIYLFNPNKDSIVKTLILELLKEQEIEEVFKVTKNKEVFQIIPKKMVSPEELPIYNQVNKLLDTHLSDNNPSCLSMCTFFWRWYNYLLYPNTFSTKDGNNLAATINYYVLKLQKQNIDIDYFCNEYKANKEQVKKLLKDLEALYKEG